MPDEIGSVLRAKALFTDNNGYVEAVTSAATNLVDHTDVPDMLGSVTMVGALKPGYTLFANVTDPNGLVGEPTYAWYRGDTDTAITELIGGATASTYTLTSADSYKYIKVVASYSDLKGTPSPISVISHDPANTLTQQVRRVGASSTNSGDSTCKSAN
jgi:hypothetical protein